MIDDRAANWAQTHLHFHVTPFFIWKEEMLVRTQISLLLVSYNHLHYIKPHACQHKGQKDAVLQLCDVMRLMMLCACM